MVRKRLDEDDTLIKMNEVSATSIDDLTDSNAIGEKWPANKKSG